MARVICSSRNSRDDSSWSWEVASLTRAASFLEWPWLPRDLKAPNMVIRCPRCSLKLDAHGSSMGWGMLVCPCENIFLLSDVLKDRCPSPPDLENPSEGVSVDRSGDDVVLRASARSPIRFLVLPVTFLWPAVWVPFIFDPLVRGRWIEPLILIPFLLFFFLVLFFLAFLSLIRAGGRVEVRLAGTEGTAFRGVGRLGFRGRFRVDEVRRVTVTRPGFWNGWRRIALEGSRRVVFGAPLSGVRFSFLFQALLDLMGECRGLLPDVATDGAVGGVAPQPR